MKKKELIDLLDKYDDDIEIFAYNNVNPCGNISEVETVNKDVYGFFGKSIDCVILGFEPEDDE